MTGPVPQHGGQMRQLCARFGLELESLLDFSANINPEGPPAGVVEALRAALEEPATLASYPDLEEYELRLAIAGHAGVGLEQIAVAHGVIPLLEASLRAYGVRRCLLPVPSFSEYRSALERAGVAVTAVYDGVRFEAGYDALLLANPANPTGALMRRDEALALVEEAARRGVRVLLDEAFIDYAPMHSLVGEVHRLPNLTVFRSLTKFYSIPGLRVAYAVAHPQVAAGVQAEVAAWPITTLASIGARAALEDEGYVGRTVRRNEERRERLIGGMKGLGFEAYPSAANFVLVRMRDGVDATLVWERLIVEHGIVLRECANFEGLGEGHLRCLVRSDVDNERLLRALGDILGGA